MGKLLKVDDTTNVGDFLNLPGGWLGTEELTLNLSNMSEYLDSGEEVNVDGVNLQHSLKNKTE